MPNFILPWYAKWVALFVLALSIFFYGYVKGSSNEQNKVAIKEIQIVYKQGKVTERIVTKYIKIKQKQQVIDNKTQSEGSSYAIKFPNDSYTFNNEFVRLYDNSATGTISTLPSGEPAGDSRVGVSEVLNTSIGNNIIARSWKIRALECEEWTKEQESLNK
jgi:hypothetical protein